MDCIQGSLIMLGQIRQLLLRLSKEAYQAPLPVLNGSSVGQHFRHILNFYQSVVQSADEEVIDYARRDRNPLIEEDPGLALISFRAIETALPLLDEKRLLQVMADFVAEAGADRPVVDSSVGRELMYAFDHALHHLAIIKIGLREVFPEIQMESHIGVAPSTLTYQSANPNMQASGKNEA